VPFAHMEELKERLESPNSTWVECPNSGHMDAYATDHVLYWSAVKKFWQDYVL
jgi:pimeloyl-ACP methyl ester carboxylesterase